MMCSRFTAPGNCLCLAEHPRPRAGGAGGARWHLNAWCPEPGRAPGTAALPPWCSWHWGAAPRWVPSTFPSPTACFDPSPLGTAPSHVPLQCRPGWGLQGSRVWGPGANPLWNAPGWGRGAPARLGAGSVGFQGSCRAGAATGTDGSGLAPLGLRLLGFWPCPGLGCHRPCGQRGGKNPSPGPCWWLGAPRRWVAGWHLPGTGWAHLGGSGKYLHLLRGVSTALRLRLKWWWPRWAGWCWERVLEPASGLSCGMWDVQDRAKGRGRLPAAQNTRKGCGRAGVGAGRVLPWGGQHSPSPSGERPELPTSCRAPGVGAGSPAPMGGGVRGGASPRSPGLSPGMVWPRCGGAAPGGVCTAHTLPVSEDCRELCKHGRAPCLTAPRGESRVPWQLLGSPGPRAAGGDRGATPGETQPPLLLHGDRGCDPQGCIS